MSKAILNIISLKPQHPRPTVYNESNLPTFTMDAGDVSAFMEVGFFTSHFFT